MSDELTLPTPADFCRFIEALFADQPYQIDTKSKRGHIVFRVPGHPHNIAVPRKRIVPQTFNGLLADLGITLAEYRRLAGTKKQLKAYIKQRKKETSDD